jgi:hypothetical protein
MGTTGMPSVAPRCLMSRSPTRAAGAGSRQPSGESGVFSSPSFVP